MRWCVAFVLCTACFGSAFEVERRAFALQSRGAGSFFYLDGHLVDRGSELTFIRGERRSPSVLAASLIVGDEGICVPSYYDVALFWRAVRLDNVDARIETLVLPAIIGVTVTRVDEKAWEVRGANAALRIWIKQHMYKREKALRSFVDLPTMTYSVRTSIGWRAIDRRTFERLATRSELSDREESVVGWSWSDFDHVGYDRVWSDHSPSNRELAEMNADNDRAVQRVIHDASGLPPGPCPLRDGGTPLLKAPDASFAHFVRLRGPRIQRSTEASRR
jgi:hypothetical protein